jgi:penicillin-binding protein 2
MIQPPGDQRRPPMLTPQLARRVTFLGGFALALFAILFFRLWFLQILSGQKYVAQASANGSIRSLEIPAPRGEVIDSRGNLLVDNTRALDVQLAVPHLPRSARAKAAEFRRIDRVLRLSPRRRRCPVAVPNHAHPVVEHLGTIQCDIAQQQAQIPYANVTIKKNVSRAVQFYVLERQNFFPGVQVEQVYERSYPLGSLAAQLFGTVGPVTPQEFKSHDPRFAGATEQDVVGQSGLEWNYNRYLQGRDGADRVLVDAAGNFVHFLKKRAPMPGHILKLSLDMKLQRAGQEALAQSIATNAPGHGGAFVAMNPQNGQIYAMGSLPTFNPNIFTKAISKQAFARLNNPANDFPLLNRAIQSVGPTGSTFKPITATAALESGAWSLNQTYDDTGQFCLGGVCRQNAGGAANGVLNLVNAIKVSDDVFFYNLGALTNKQRPIGGPLQHWANLYGIGRASGVDLGGEYPGNLPSPAWRTHIDRVERECEQGIGPFKGHGKHGSCGISDGRPWSAGDNVNLAVGQGDVQVSPLQLAVAYSAIANGGNIVRPHVGSAIESANGQVLQRINPPAVRHLNINPAYLGAIRQGLHDAAQTAGGTSDAVFGNFPKQVYGKTGTAQLNGQQDTAWYACFVPAWATKKPILVVVKVENGGFGAIGAAPVARQILSQWFFGKKGNYIPGTSRTL